MLKWFEHAQQTTPNIVLSRVRLARNLEDYAFPPKITDADALNLIKKVEFGLKNLHEFDGRNYEYAFLDEIREVDRRALRERRILNSTIVNKKSPTGIIISEEEDVSIILNGADHIRLQMLSTGLKLEELWNRADKLDDYINARFSYAYDEKYGYLTSYPTNVGTGLRASVLMHLPTLSKGKKFSALIGDMGRIGVTIKSVNGEGSENYGNLYEVSNPVTLGRTEKEIIDLISKAANQLNSQECHVRQIAIKNNPLEKVDDVYKSYGVLKYARKLSYKEAMSMLSQIMAGAADGLLKLDEPCSIYRLMLGIQPANLQKISEKPLDKSELEAARANYLREELPKLA